MIGQFILPVCTAIYEALKDEYLKLPSTKNEWLSIANETNKRWHYPNLLGTADGKHIQIVHPRHSGATFYNYKGFFSIVLMDIADYDYKFLYVNVGCQGRISDGGVFQRLSDSDWLWVTELIRNNYYTLLLGQIDDTIL